MKSRTITSIEGAIDLLSERIRRNTAKKSVEQTLCLLYANGAHFFIATRAGRADAESRIPFDKRDYVQATFTNALLPCAYYYGEEQ